MRYDPIDVRINNFYVRDMCRKEQTFLIKHNSKNDLFASGDGSSTRLMEAIIAVPSFLFDRNNRFIILATEK